MDNKYAVFVSINGKYIDHTRHNDRRVKSVRNGKKCEYHKIDWCEVDLQLAYIVNKKIGENDLNLRMKYLMVRLYN